MTAEDHTLSKPVRLVFELAREDNPRLFDELVRFPQGQKRVNRLRVLAYDGLLVQHGVIAMAGATAPQREVAPAGAAQLGVSNGVFGPGVDV